jgi:Mg2+ and Co2+ transporter CorA
LIIGRLGLLMTSLARLLAQRRRLLERLQENPGAHEREEIQRLLREIDEALALLDESGPGISEHRHE